MAFPYPENVSYSKNVPPTFYVQDISNWTTNEVEQLIFHNKKVDELVSMPEWVAKQVIEHKHFSQRLRDWAFDTLI